LNICWIIDRAMQLAADPTETGRKVGSSTAIPRAVEQEIRRVILSKLQRRLPVKSSPRRREVDLMTPPGD
jgi:hypothetical protein